MQQSPTQTTPDIDRAQLMLQDVFGFSSFRPNQKEIITAILARQDVFAVMPTGGGKSLCYQLPARIMDGLCVVVSPLISLMKDQVDAAKENGLRAELLNSTLSGPERAQVYRSLDDGTIDLLYLSPERFTMPEFIEKLKQWPLAFFAIDEAHCVSEWGHDFRPDYLELARIVKEFPGVPVAAFTATATHRVQQDIVSRLGLRQPHMVRASFDRPNLYYKVEPKDSVDHQLVTFIRARKGEAGVVYRGSRKSVESTTEKLNAAGIKALAYHAGMAMEDRQRNQDAFNRDEVDVIVATIAFGMGIDKSNIRFVLHADLPRNIEGYYQETGRAGRDGEPARCVLYFSRGDCLRLKHFIDQMEDVQARTISLAQMNQMVRFAERNRCRRAELLEYFGETGRPNNCGNCDICAGEVESVDATIAAQKVLSAMARTRQRFGAGHIVDIIRGADTERIRQYEHDKLPTWGCGKDEPVMFWRRVIDGLMAQDVVRSEADRFGGLVMTDKARAILKGGQKFSVLRATETKKSKSARLTSDRALIDYPDMPPELFERLRAERARLAREANVPAYVIFNDRTLREMASRQPKNLDEMRSISGVGEQKLASFGEDFLNVIRGWQTNPVAVIEAVVTQKSDTPSHIETLELINAGRNLEEISEERQVKLSTIIRHVVQLVEEGHAFSDEKIIDPRRKSEIAAMFHETRSKSLSAVVQHSQGSVDFEEARLVRALMSRNAKQN